MNKINVLIPKVTPRCSCGCGMRVKRSRVTDLFHNVVPGQPRSYVKGHCGAQANKKINRYIIEPESGCWIWQLSTRDGYGITKGSFQSEKVQQAHRVVYEEHKGLIPNGMVLDHLCQIRLCVNPDHLEVVTVAENNHRRYSRPKPVFDWMVFVSSC